ncbi:DUF192 domain-containing protein [Paracoccaceae bacterium GXU_MW_L88]
MSLLAGVLAAQVATGAVCAEERLDLRHEGMSAEFTVEVADDAEERAQGLMFVENMPRRSGMLFVYEEPQSVAFWMKNTEIPLDIIFAGSDGVVRRVAPMATPHDLTPIPGGDDIQYVLEINGGMAKMLGIEEGAEMRHPAIADAAWSCALPDDAISPQ